MVAKALVTYLLIEKL